MRLGTLVTGVIYRYTGILLKTATTLDVLSGAGRTSASARAVRALGARFGRPLPLDKKTLRALEETLQIAHQMWSGEVAPYRGNHYHLKEPLNSPQVLSRPHPPIMGRRYG